MVGHSAQEEDSSHHHETAKCVDASHHHETAEHVDALLLHKTGECEDCHGFGDITFDASLLPSPFKKSKV